jgi:hypothetical protein
MVSKISLPISDKSGSNWEVIEEIHILKVLRDFQTLCI